MRGLKFLKKGPKSRFFKIERKIFGTSNTSKTHFQRVFRHLRPKNFQVLYEIFFEIGYVKIEKVKKKLLFRKTLGIEIFPVCRGVKTTSEKGLK